jgi:8-oxo-dGTP diphosphatase
MDEGTLDWHEPDEIDALDMPESDRVVLWPLIREWKEGVTCIHIDCAGDTMEWTKEQ